MQDSLTPQPVDHRTLYLRALDPEGDLSLDAEEPRELLDALAAGERRALLPHPVADPPELDPLLTAAAEWRAAESARFRGVLESGPLDPLVTYILVNCAPLTLSAGAWLQWLSDSGNAERELALRVLSLYACDVGVGRPNADRGSDFRALLRRHRIADLEPDVHLTANEAIESFSFRFPSLLLAMSRRPNRFRPELLGSDLCLRAVGLLPPLDALASSGASPTLADELRTVDLAAARGEDERPARELSYSAASYLLETGDEETRRRFVRGFQWALGELDGWCSKLRDGAALVQHPDYEVWRMVCHRARQAAVYHSRFTLAGRPLAEWFSDVDAGPTPFLHALANSKLVRPGRPEASPLLRGLIGPKGPMFRIFTEQEIQVLHRWIAQLPEPGSVLHSNVPSAAHEALHETQRSWYQHSDATPPPGARSDARPARHTLRSAYRALLDREDSPGLRAFARAYAERWLARCRYRLEHSSVPLPGRWDREQGLRGWLDAEHERHSEEFEDAESSLPTREELIDSTLQLAPLILIDGGWLQGYTDYRHASSHSGHFLFRTYWDELGNGVRELNHPRIYRDLLDTMGIELPPTDSREFAEWSGFREESFALPVFWLSVSRFPRTFLPEILGLNLAMELSGVGGSYRSARVALRHYGYSTQFVDLHNTIDNVATGHSAWAAEAIDTHIAGLPELVGPGQEAAVWHRVKTGYRSLNPPQGVSAKIYAALNSPSASAT